MTVLDSAWLDSFERQFGPIARSLGRLIRPTIIAPAGQTFVWGDWSAIEARTLPWLANSPGAEKVLDIFRSNDKDPSAPDIYMIAAGAMFDKDPREITKPERQIGKVICLSLGYGGAEGALGAMATGYGIYLSPEQKTHAVTTWRGENAWAKTFWGAHGRDGSYGIWGAICSAVEDPDTIHQAGRVAYVFDRSYMGGTIFCALPDGRLLTYPRAKWEKREVEDKKTGKVTERTQLTFLRAYGRKALWPGLCCENVTQATAASILRGKLVQLRSYRSFFPVVAHTHDEIVGQCSEETAERWEALLLRIMSTNDAWNEGLPLAAETTSSWYYTKAA